jgi:hypothetical protein
MFQFWRRLATQMTHHQVAATTWVILTSAPDRENVSSIERAMATARFGSAAATASAIPASGLFRKNENLTGRAAV